MPDDDIARVHRQAHRVRERRVLLKDPAPSQHVSSQNGGDAHRVAVAAHVLWLGTPQQVRVVGAQLRQSSVRGVVLQQAVAGLGVHGHPPRQVQVLARLGRVLVECADGGKGQRAVPPERGCEPCNPLSVVGWRRGRWIDLHSGAARRDVRRSTRGAVGCGPAGAATRGGGSSLWRAGAS